MHDYFKDYYDMDSLTLFITIVVRLDNRVAGLQLDLSWITYMHYNIISRTYDNIQSIKNILSMVFSFSDAVFGLKGVRIWNPEAIRAGEQLRLSCDYDLEGVPLYSIKWYFGDQEFYRFVPKESPPTRVFPLSGTTSVDVSII